MKGVFLMLLCDWFKVLNTNELHCSHCSLNLKQKNTALWLVTGHINPLNYSHSLVHPLMNLLLVCLNSSICCAPALKSVTGRYECSEDLLDDRRGSLKFITPLDASFGKSTKYWLSMTKEILTSSNLRTGAVYAWEIPNFYPPLRRTLLLTIFKVTDARHDVILTGGLHHRFPWRHLPHPVSFLLRTKSRVRPSGPSPCAFPVGA